MNYRILFICALAGLAACNGSNSSTPQTDTSASTFTDADAAALKPNAEAEAAALTAAALLAAETEAAAIKAKADEAADADTKAKIEAELKAQADKLIVTAAELVKAGQDGAAVEALKQAGLVKAASKDGELRQAETLFTAAKLPEEAFLLFAPDDYVLEDKTVYGGLPADSLAAAVDEKPSVKRHKMTLDGQTFWLTASAGHLTAFAKNPEKQDPQASIFYTAYTRDDLPKENRPVTFFFNGGPGASSIYLHMASWAPKHVVIDALNVPDSWTRGRPQTFDFIDSQESLIDRTDLVFVDIVPGTGYSEAIAPNTNQTFWSIDKDVELSRQFITRYINVNRRQESPKYLYGESYSGGIRVPKLIQALEDAGIGGYEKVETVDKFKFKVLTGAVFHSPAFDYNSTNQVVSDFPTFAMVADFLGKSTAPDEQTSIEAYAETVRSIAARYSTAPRFTASSYTGIPMRIPTYLGGQLNFGRYTEALMPGYAFNSYDGRMHLKLEPFTWMPDALTYSFDFFEEDALNNRITSHLPEYVNYTAKAHYINGSWQTSDPVPEKGPELAFELWQGRNGASGLANIVAAIARDPSLKLLTVHGYHDTVTPFVRSELDLKGVVFDPAKNLTLLDRVPVKNFVGGHMIYYAQESRAPLIKTLHEFYDAPPYGTGPTIAKAQSLSIPSPAQHAPATAISLH